MKATVKCPKCNHSFDAEVAVGGRELNQYGFTVNSKGDVICRYLESKPQASYNDILNHLMQKYPEDNSTGRLNRVLHEMKANKHLVQDGKAYKLIRKTPARPEAEKAPQK